MYVPKSPLVLSLDLTSRCNLSCSHCLANADPNGASIPQKTVTSIIDEAQRIGIKELVLGGGEVLLYENFFDICRHALSKGLRISFATNGTLIPEKINEFSKFDTYNRYVKVGLSLDGHTPEVHGHFRPKETFGQVVDAIRLLHEADVDVHILCVLNRENIKLIPEFLDFVFKLEISDVRFIPFMPVGRGAQYRNEMVSPRELYAVLQQKQNWCKAFGSNIGLHMPWEFLFHPPESRRPSPCEASYLRLWIDSNGDIFPCAFLSDFAIGNVYHDSIGDVWLNSPILKQLRDPTLLKGACSTCNYRNGCRGGCRGLAQFLEGDYLCTDPYCPIVNQR